MRIGYYPGCSAEGSGVEYGLSTRRIAEILDVELVELDDWNCCGATSAHNTDKMLSLALPARNLAIAEQAGLNTILAPCAACYSRHRTSEEMARHDQGLREKLEELIDMEFKADTSTISVLEWLEREVGLDKIKSKVSRSLKGMKAACYYGCLLVRPVEHTGYDDPEDPQSMDRIVNALGAECVDWAFKTECCGASIATSRPEIGARMIYEVIRNAQKAGAECLVTACPLCMLNLDMRQGGTAKTMGATLNMPVYYVTELVAIAAGVAPREVGVNRHFVEAETYLASLPAKAAAIEAEEAARKAAEKPARAKKKAEEVEVAGKANAAEPATKKELVSEEPKPMDSTGEEADAQQKKVDAMIKALQKNTEKMAVKLIGDEEKGKVLTEVLQADEKKLAKLAELMVTDKDKAAKAGEAFVAAELKKRAK
jgi:heterodisulfide reductase subunit B